MRVEKEKPMKARAADPNIRSPDKGMPRDLVMTGKRLTSIFML
jgi:hypothetical protein